MPGTALESTTEPAGFRCPACAPTISELDGFHPGSPGKSYVASFGQQWNRYEVARDAEDEVGLRREDGRRPLRPRRPARARRRLRRWPLCPCRRAARGKGRRASASRRGNRREGRGPLCRPADVSILQADLTSPASGRGGRSTSPSPIRRPPPQAPTPLRGVRRGGAERSEARGADSPSGSTDGMRYRRSGSNSALRPAITTRLPAWVLEPLVRGPGRRSAASGPEQGGSARSLNFSESPRLDAPRLRQLRPGTPPISVSTTRPRTEAMVRRGGLRRPGGTPARPRRPALRLGLSARTW